MRIPVGSNKDYEVPVHSGLKDLGYLCVEVILEICGLEIALH